MASNLKAMALNSLLVTFVVLVRTTYHLRATASNLRRWPPTSLRWPPIFRFSDWLRLRSFRGGCLDPWKIPKARLLRDLYRW